MKTAFYFACIFVLSGTAGCAQKNSAAANHTQTVQQRVGRSCEGCEAIYAGKKPFAKLSSVDTLPDYNEPGPKLIVNGIIFKKDGKTPAKGVVLYIYHTDQSGHYTNKFNEAGWAGRNGYCKGWIKTNDKGEYKFYTLLPGHYPNTTIPAHIHPIIKEPGMDEYYIDEYLFKGDKYLTKEAISRSENRGGSGVVSLKKQDGILYAQRNIILGLNIPNYNTAIK